MSKYRRIHYLINKRFQLKYTIAMVAMIAAVMMATGIGLYVGMWSSIIENFSQFKVSEDLETARRIAGYEEARYGQGDFRLEKIFREAELLSTREKESLHKALNSVNKSFIPKMIVLIIIIFLAGILISHRIAGPMYRFEESARAIRNGDLSVNFNIRKSDEMHDISIMLEEMVESLRKDMEKVKTSSLYLKESIDSFAGDMPEGEAKRLKELVSEIHTVLSKYKI
jgi:methyl-accepting chemotaxis protein